HAPGVPAYPAAHRSGAPAAAGGHDLRHTRPGRARGRGADPRGAERHPVGGVRPDAGPVPQAAADADQQPAAALRSRRDDARDADRQHRADPAALPDQSAQATRGDGAAPQPGVGSGGVLMNATHEDEALLERLRAICAEVDPVPDLVFQAARAAFTLRRLDAELAELVLDSADEPAGAVAVRAAG